MPDGLSDDVLLAAIVLGGIGLLTWFLLGRFTEPVERPRILEPRR